MPPVPGRWHLLAAISFGALSTLTLASPTAGNTTDDPSISDASTVKLQDNGTLQDSALLGTTSLTNLEAELRVADARMKSQDRSALLYHAAIALDPRQDMSTIPAIESSLLSYFVPPIKFYRVEKDSEQGPTWHVYKTAAKPAGTIAPFDVTFSRRISVSEAYKLVMAQGYVSWFERVEIERLGEDSLPSYKFVRRQWDRMRTCTVDVITQDIKCNSQRLGQAEENIDQTDLGGNSNTTGNISAL